MLVVCLIVFGLILYECSSEYDNDKIDMFDTYTDKYDLIKRR